MSREASPKPSMLDLWQHRLLPVMVGVVLVLAIFFFVATIYQLFLLNEKIDNAPLLKSDEILLRDSSHKDSPQRGYLQSSFVEHQWDTLVLLEFQTLQQRYHQANVLLMSRTWVRYLGFISGMVLAFIGAIFILGKLTDQPTSLSVGPDNSDSGQKPESGKVADPLATRLALQQASLKMTLATQSPGIVLAVLGTFLMLVTIIVHRPIEVSDVPSYLNIESITSGTPPMSTPKPLQTENGNSAASRQDGTQLQSLIDQIRKKHGQESQGSEGPENAPRDQASQEHAPQENAQ